MSSKFSKRRQNPGTPKICRTKPLPIPYPTPPIPPPPWPPDFIYVKVIMDWVDGMMGPIHVDQEVNCPWDPAILAYRGGDYIGWNWLVVTVRPDTPSPTQVVTLEAMVDGPSATAGPTVFPLVIGTETHYLHSTWDTYNPWDLSASAEYDL